MSKVSDTEQDADAMVAYIKAKAAYIKAKSAEMSAIQATYARVVAAAEAVYTKTITHPESREVKK